MTSRWIIAVACACSVGLITVPLFVAGTGAKLEPASSSAVCKADSAANFKFTLKDPNGGSLKLADYKGKVILLNFWGTWCAPCRMEMPALIALQQDYRAKGLVILGIAVEDTPEAVKAYAAEAKINYPLAMSQEDFEDAYGPMVGLPMSFFIARDGSICKKHLGPITKADAENEIKSLM